MEGEIHTPSCGIDKVLADCIYADPEARMGMTNQMFVRVIPRLTLVVCLVLTLPCGFVDIPNAYWVPGLLSKQDEIF